MQTRGWPLSTFVGCCIWILQGMSYILMLTHVLYEPLQGIAGTLVRCFSLLVALEPPLMTKSSQYIAAKELGKVFYEAGITLRGWLQEWTHGRGESPALEPTYSPSSKGSKESQRGSRDTPIPPTSWERANSVLHPGAPLHMLPTTGWRGVGGVSCSAWKN